MRPSKALADNSGSSPCNVRKKYLCQLFTNLLQTERLTTEQRDKCMDNLKAKWCKITQGTHEHFMCGRTIFGFHGNVFLHVKIQNFPLINKIPNTDII